MSKKLNVREATSFCDGIEFYSKRNKGYIAKATLVEDGTIVTSYAKKKEISSEKKSFAQNLAMWAGIVTLAVVFTFAIMGISYLLKLEGRRQFGFMWFTISVFGLIAFVVRTTKKRRTPEGRSTYRFHSAEHMAINAMKKLQRVPTLEEIKQFSRFENGCGSNGTAIMTFNYLWLAFCITFLQGISYIVIAPLGLCVIMILYLLSGLNFLQYLSTIKPTDKELEVAVAGIQEWYNHETA